MQYAAITGSEIVSASCHINRTDYLTNHEALWITLAVEEPDKDLIRQIAIGQSIFNLAKLKASSIKHVILTYPHIGCWKDAEELVDKFTLSALSNLRQSHFVAWGVIKKAFDQDLSYGATHYASIDEMVRLNQKRLIKYHMCQIGQTIFYMRG